MAEKRDNVAVHHISLRGTAGAIFVTLVLAIIFFVIGFATPNWSRHSAGANVSTQHLGLWEECSCVDHERNEDWFLAFQVLICCGLAGLFISFLLASLYICVLGVSKNATIKALVAFCFITVAVMLTGFILYGIEEDGLNWSFAVSVVGCFFTLVAGVLSAQQLRASGVSLV